MAASPKDPSSHGKSQPGQEILRADGCSLRDFHGGTRNRIEVGVSIGIQDSHDQLGERIARFVGDRGRLWITWPKKASGVQSDLTQAVVRRTGLAAGLVDYKIGALDETWSALLFTRRKSP